MAERDGRRQLGTLGRGNHFVELQREDQGALWAMIHTGSRAMGGAIRERFLKRAETDRSGLRFLHADTDDGAAYLRAIEWARAYAAVSRRTIADRLRAILHDVLGAEPDESSWIDVDHNHVRSETHLSRVLWVHRKGAMHAPAGAFDTLLDAIAADVQRALWVSARSGAVFAPYDGGADLIVPSEVERDALAETFAAWRSPRPDGL